MIRYYLRLFALLTVLILTPVAVFSDIVMKQLPPWKQSELLVTKQNIEEWIAENPVVIWTATTFVKILGR